MKIFIIVIIALIIAAAVLSLLFVIVMFSKCVLRPKAALHFGSGNTDNTVREKIKSGREWFLAQNPQEVSITSYDGLKLYGTYLPHRDARGTILLMHGFQSNGLHDFACIFKTYYNLGFSLLVPDQRAMNRSEGKYLTFGVRERFDCRDWVRFINTLSDVSEKPIVLNGVSMGSTTVLMSLGLELPNNAACVIADCGFTSPRDIFRHVLHQYFSLPPFPILYLSGLMTRLFAGFKIGEYSTLDALQNNKIPVLFIHGSADNFVPAVMSQQNFNACTCEKDIFIADGAGHGMSYVIKRKECEEKLFAFLDKYAPFG